MKIPYKVIILTSIVSHSVFADNGRLIIKNLSSSDISNISVSIDYINDTLDKKYLSETTLKAYVAPDLNKKDTVSDIEISTEILAQSNLPDDKNIDSFSTVTISFKTNNGQVHKLVMKGDGNNNPNQPNYFNQNGTYSGFISDSNVVSFSILGPNIDGNYNILEQNWVLSSPNNIYSSSILLPTTKQLD